MLIYAAAYLALSYLWVALHARCVHGDLPAIPNDDAGSHAIELDLSAVPAATGMPPHEVALSETPGFLLEVAPGDVEAVLAHLRGAGVEAAAIGSVTPQPRFCLRWAGAIWCDADSAVLHRAWSARLEAITHTVMPAVDGGEA